MSNVWVHAPQGLALRAQANASANVVTGLSYGQPLTALGAETGPDGSGRTWLQVQTADGQTGYVVTSLEGDRLVANQPPDRYTVKVLNTSIVIGAAGLAVRDHRDQNLTALDRVQPGEQLTVYDRVIDSGVPWLWVQSPRNQYGWSLEQLGGVALVDPVGGTTSTPSQPTVPSTSGDAWVIASDGLNLRNQGSRSGQLLATLSYGQHLKTVGSPSAPDDAGIVWQQVSTDNGQTGYVAVIADGSTNLSNTQPPAPVSVVPWGKCLAGLGMGNPQPLTPGQIKLIGDAKLEAFKVLTLPDPGLNQQLIAQLKKIRSDMFIAARLFFSVDANSKTRFNAQNFVDFCMNGLTACYQAGVRYFEVHNEPNLPNEGLGWNWNNGGDFGAWLQQVLSILRPRFPDAKWGYPGLSPQANNQYDVDTFLNGSLAAANACDWIGVHCYWQTVNGPQYPMTADSDGMYWRAKFRPRFPNKMLMITEFSNNSAGVSPNDKGTQYADYIKMLRSEPNLGAAFGFALSWPGQDNNHEAWEGTAIGSAFAARASSVGALA